MSRGGCFGGWWGRWDALVRFYRPGNAPETPTDGELTSETFAGVVQRHALDDAARDDGGAFATHPDNIFSAFELAHDDFVGVDASDAAAISARLNALRPPSDNFKTGGDWVRFFVVGLSNLTAKPEPSVFETVTDMPFGLATLNAKSVT